MHIETLFLRLFEPDQSEIKEIVQEIVNIHNGAIFKNGTDPFLLMLINYSLTNGIFPNNCKISKAIPIHKNGDTNNPNKFRPILLTCFLKILEKVAFTRITCFITKHDVLNPQQYGFQKDISTAHAILNTVTSTFDNINRNQFTDIFFLDFIKSV